MLPSPFQVDRPRLLGRLGALARIGALEGGGVRRLAFSEADMKGREFVAQRLRALGLDVRIDAIGNLFGVRPGEADGPPVLLGSHTDTVSAGGAYDGSLGVLAALEVMEVLEAAGIATRRAVAVASFVNEEGARFMPDMMGSLVFTGGLELEAARAALDSDGVSVGAAMGRIGYAGADDVSDLFPPHAFVELHIEQGPVLEAESKAVGVVTGVQGITWLEVRFEGEANHAGATPMAARRDAGYAAAVVAAGVRAVSRAVEGQRATVGTLRLAPGVVNVIPGEAVLTVDLRNPDAARLAEAEASVRRMAEAAAREEGVEVTIRKTVEVAPVLFDERLVAVIEEVAQARGHAARRLTSGAAHDAQILAASCPAAMIFVPSRGGISHNPREHTAPDLLVAGADVLLHTVLALAEPVGG